MSEEDKNESEEITLSQEYWIKQHFTERLAIHVELFGQFFESPLCLACNDAASLDYHEPGKEEKQSRSTKEDHPQQGREHH